MGSFREFVRENREIIKKMLAAGKFTREQEELILLADPSLEQQLG
jgi:hypothetical protein